MFKNIFLVVIILLITSCGSSAENLYGHYEIEGGTSRRATLEIEKPGSFEFCYEQKCSSGKFKLVGKFDDSAGRVRFFSPALEDYARILAADAVGQERVLAAQGPALGSVDLNYHTGLSGAVISVGPASDIEFVKK